VAEAGLATGLATGLGTGLGVLLGAVLLGEALATFDLEGLVLTPPLGPVFWFLNQSALSHLKRSLRAFLSFLCLIF